MEGKRTATSELSVCQVLAFITHIHTHTHTRHTKGHKGWQGFRWEREPWPPHRHTQKGEGIARLPPLPVNSNASYKAEFFHLQALSSEHKYITCRMRKGRYRHLSAPAIFGDPLNTHMLHFPNFYRKAKKGHHITPSMLIWR